MICARCARQVATGARACPNCAGDPLLDGRYRLDLQLGGDLLGASFQATRIADDALVRARAYRVQRDSAPRIEQRLAQLRELDHPALPRRLDELVTGEAEVASQWLIDEHRPGPTLADAIAAAPDHRVDSQSIIATVRQIAELLDVLGRQRSAIVHGGLTPHSILVATGERDAAVLDLGLGSELVRTSSTRGLADSLGYSAPEQLYADATPAADVWALAAIAVVALSGSSLSSMRDSATLRWRERVDLPLTTTLARTLERMLEPDPITRISASEVARALLEFEPASNQHHPWTPSRAPHAAVTPPPRPCAPRPARVGPKPVEKKADVPVMRPDELSRDLSQAHQVTVAIEQQQRNQLVIARVLVVLVTAIIAGLTTYIAIALI